MKYFCSKCGKTTLYNLDLPKFCSSCGQLFNSKFNNNELKSKENINDIKKFEIQNQEEDIINIDFKKVKPSFKIDIYKNQNETFGSLIDNPSKPVDINIIDKEYKTSEQILNEFQKEAGLSRPKE